MQKKNKILILGPLGAFGGREIESGFIANALSNSMLVTVMSTIYCSKKSQIFDFIAKDQFVDLYGLLFKKKIFIRFFACLSYIKSGFKKEPYYYVNNSLSKKNGFHEKALSILLHQIAQNDLVIICAQLSSTYMKEIVAYCDKNSIPILFRPSNTIKAIDSKHEKWMQKVSLFIIHSFNNANQFDFIRRCNSILIDQCCRNENDLFFLPPVKKIQRLLFVGRLSEEKGIIELIHFCSKIETISLSIIGDGPLLEPIRALLKETKNIQLLGYQSQNDMVKFIEQSDAFVISSYEESGPIAGLEAMASGRIVISTAVGSMMDRLHNLTNQFWFSIEDFSSFEAVIHTLQTLNEKEVLEIAIENRKRYQNEYTIDKIAAQYKHVVHSFLK